MGWIKAGGAALGLFLLVLSYWYTFKKGADFRELEIMRAISEDTIEAAEDAREVMKDATKKLNSDTDKIIGRSKDGDGPLAPVLRDQLERMRDNKSEAARKVI